MTALFILTAVVFAVLLSSSRGSRDWDGRMGTDGVEIGCSASDSSSSITGFVGLLPISFVLTAAVVETVCDF